MILCKQKSYTGSLLPSLRIRSVPPSPSGEGWRNNTFISLLFFPYWIFFKQILFSERVLILPSPDGEGGCRVYEADRRRDPVCDFCLHKILGGTSKAPSPTGLRRITQIYLKIINSFLTLSCRQERVGKKAYRGRGFDSPAPIYPYP